MVRIQRNPQIGLPAVTLVRARRLVALVVLLGKGPLARSQLLRRLKLDIRGFYRDLECLHSAGVEVSLAKGKYSLHDDPATALTRIPFPDPGLTLGEAIVLARGKSSSHKKLGKMIQQVTGATKVPPPRAGRRQK